MVTVQLANAATLPGVTLTGQIIVIDPPASVVPGALENKDQMQVFAERTGLVLSDPVTVDFTKSGDYDQEADLPDLKPVIPAGTVVNSYFIHVDQPGDTGSTRYNATITFPAEVIGVMVTGATLTAGHALLGVPGTTYGASVWELNALCATTGQDCVTLSSDRKTLILKATDWNVADHMRVITEGQYGLCVLYDQNKAHKAGSTVPVKLQLCDASGQNLSSADVVVHAVSLTQVDSSASAVVEDSGNANPEDDFRYDASLGETGGYIYNLSTKGLATGTYQLAFSVDGNTFPSYIVSFDVR